MGIFNWLVPLAIEIIKSYINSTSSKRDDEVLAIVQDGASYLANKQNNNVSNYEASILRKKEIIKSEVKQNDFR